MNKTQLAADVAARTGSTPTEARRHVDAVLSSIVESVADGDRVSLVGFGTFTGAERPARTARNPQTGATVEVPAAVVPRFRAGTGFKTRVTESGTPTPPAASPSRVSASSKAPTSTSKKSKDDDSSDKKADKKKDSKKKDKKNKKGKKNKKK